MAVMCDTYERWTHIKCGNISPSQYVELSRSEELWSCDHCKDDIIFSSLILFFQPEINSDSDTSISDINNIQTLHCEHYDNINDSYIPTPDPEEDWDSLPAPLPESDSDNLESNSDLVLSASYSVIGDKNIDVYDQLRKLKKENKNRPISCYLIINSIRYKFYELKEVLTNELVDMLIFAETKIV